MGRFERVTARDPRIPVATVLAMLAEGMTEAEILEACPDLEPTDIREVLRFASETPEGAIAVYAAARPEILAVVLFGSRVRGTARPSSDWDIALLVDVPRYEAMNAALPYGYVVNVWSDLAAVLGTERLDVIILHEAPTVLANEVVSEGRLVFCRDENAWMDFVVRTKSMYADEEPLRRTIREYLYRRIRERVQGGGP